MVNVEFYLFSCLERGVVIWWVVIVVVDDYFFIFSLEVDYGDVGVFFKF